MWQLNPTAGVSSRVLCPRLRILLLFLIYQRFLPTQYRISRLLLEIQANLKCTLNLRVLLVRQLEFDILNCSSASGALANI